MFDYGYLYLMESRMSFIYRRSRTNYYLDISLKELRMVGSHETLFLKSSVSIAYALHTV